MVVQNDQVILLRSMLARTLPGYNAVVASNCSRGGTQWIGGSDHGTALLHDIYGQKIDCIINGQQKRNESYKYVDRIVSTMDP